MNPNNAAPWDADVAIVGGGLAGLSVSIQLASAGYRVVLCEKQAYPMHRVCGEYISQEVLPFMASQLQIDPFAHGAVRIGRLEVTAPAGATLSHELGLGGFGWSRYAMDLALRDRALAVGVTVHERTNVLDIRRKADAGHEVVTNAHGTLTVRHVVGAFGKRSNLDRQLSRSWFYKRSPYIGVKRHIRWAGMADDVIALHNFDRGYCGISRVEDDVFCLCYLAHRSVLDEHKTLAEMEAAIVCQNPHLARIWAEAEMLWPAPKVINEVTFVRKSLSQDGIWFCGDTAGMIAPLCGNGMAMALHSSQLLATALLATLSGECTEEAARKQYQKAWQKAFGTRLWIGRRVQSMFGQPRLTDAFVRVMRPLPRLTRTLVRLTHGRPF